MSPEIPSLVEDTVLGIIGEGRGTMLEWFCDGSWNGG